MYDLEKIKGLQERMAQLRETLSSQLTSQLTSDEKALMDKVLIEKTLIEKVLIKKAISASRAAESPDINREESDFM